MYIPRAFAVEELDAVCELIEQNGFATLVSGDEGRQVASHLPVVLQREGDELLLQGHFARANPQWQSLAGQEVLLIFHGPHCFVSTSWYESPSAPTWNYAVVHLHGQVELLQDEEELKGMMQSLVDKYEQGRWRLQWQAQQQKLLKGIVGFTIRPTEIEAKFKLSQNRSEADQYSIVEQLSQSSEQQEQAVAHLMRRYVLKNSS